MTTPTDLTEKAQSVADTHPAHPEPAGVSIHGLSKRYHAGAVALDHIDLDCPAGEITVLVGPSGCGKTTLLRSIAGLEQPTNGSIRIGGHDVTHTEPQRRGVAMVFQNYALYPDKTARENIAFPLRMARVTKAERNNRIDAVAQLLRLEGLLDRKPAELSGGQRQRVGIGRALVRGPSVLLMDEPLSNLDAQLRVEMRAELLALQRDLGTTMVYVTHDQVEALTLGSTVVVMNGGKISQAGIPEQVYTRPENAFVAGFLGGMNLIDGHVDTRHLISGEARISLPRHLHSFHGRRITLGIRPESLSRGRASDDELGATGPVVLTELLGSDRMIHIGGYSTALRMREEHHTPVGDSVAVRADAADIHVFLPDRDGERAQLP
ncbi:ABC transporter ATP-binding protein [Saccharopolyspora hattusasensis]|uniref:ABC transporter ATP-binding protein n=1 Tax=Saccharopolyspora hattusasensis TaxID=1128679 RepID=UPI003D98228E